MTHPLDREQLRARVQTAVETELAHQRQVLAEIGPDLQELVDDVARLLAGGKRFRAAFAYWGYRCGGQPGADPVIRLATAMEFFQAAALLHDDVMDGSDVRRGQPSAHRAAATRHTERGWDGDPDRFGEAAAILAGDLCLQWTDELYATSGLPVDQLAAARGTFDRMRTQLMGGQFLDLLESARGWAGLDTAQRLASARRVIRYKSAKYTIEAPLLIGAEAAGVPLSARGGLSSYGLALGEAFQLRDDLLGVFGDPEQTGKPAGDDLREGKRTVLLAHALASATPAQRDLLERLIGRPDLDTAGVSVLREILVDTGAVGAIETEISQLADSAQQALARVAADLQAEAVEVLTELIEVCTARSA